jgi:hypothetical protein
MKHLRQYNENVNFEFDEEYIKECFIEFFDEFVWVKFKKNI